MRVFGGLLLLVGAGLVLLSLNVEWIAIEKAGSVLNLDQAQIAYDRMLYLIEGGFSFLSGAVLIGAGSIVAAMGRGNEVAGQSAEERAVEPGFVVGPGLKGRRPPA